MFQSETGEHGFVPEIRALNGRKCVNDAECEDTFDRPRNETKSQGLGMVFVPCLNVEGQES